MAKFVYRERNGHTELFNLDQVERIFASRESISLHMASGTHVKVHRENEPDFFEAIVLAAEDSSFYLDPADQDQED